MLPAYSKRAVKNTMANGQAPQIRSSTWTARVIPHLYVLPSGLFFVSVLVYVNIRFSEGAIFFRYYCFNVLKTPNQIV